MHHLLFHCYLYLSLPLYKHSSLDSLLKNLMFCQSLKRGYKRSEIGFTHNQREPVSIQEITLNTPVLLYKKTDPVFGWVTSLVSGVVTHTASLVSLVPSLYLPLHKPILV